MKNFAVIGSGAWGTALAVILQRNHNQVNLWAREQDVIDDILNNHENSIFLPGVKFTEKIMVSSKLEDVIKNADAVVMVVPAQFVRDVCKQMAPIWKNGLPLLICSKGIEQKTGALMSEVVKQELPNAIIAVLSGPTFAGEAAKGFPTSVTIACDNKNIGKNFVQSFGTKTFRPYYSNDVIGSQVGGAVKNVMAIAAGIVEGKGLGDNTRAALITRGLAEIVRLAKALGGKEETLMGMSGIGDLLLTANSLQSRNYTVGVELGKGKKLKEIVAGKRSIAEGVFTAQAVTNLAKKIGIEMPICQAMNAILNQDANVDDMINSLLSRPFRDERDL